ncbi:39S ribosomal protein L54, mitochondrial-like [Acanthaster planci]|uniref:Large ribosomal subunit protein mL54 n=1 Tax=Acanthaster planci TaxID=133434 RepID=A0A8B7Z9E1_ACAPL|nr:39S ribosomal protein L54, mitochondrial-like [Acanthaster planci]
MAASMRRAILLLRANMFSQAERRSFTPHLPFQSSYLIFNVWKTHVLTYAKKAGKGSRVAEPRELMQVNTDPNYLVSHCSGSNYFREGQDVKLGPDEDYPDWLWDLHIGPPPTLEEMSPDTPQYWRKLRRMHMRRNNRLAKTKKF